MKVLDSRILLEVQSDGLKEKIGNLVVDVAKGQFEIGKVIAIGSKVEGVEIGETVYIYPGAGKELTLDGKKFRVVVSNEVIVVL